jgi:glucose/arabinose dehydrogenase
MTRILPSFGIPRCKRLSALMSLLAPAAGIISGCYALRPSQGGGDISPQALKESLKPSRHPEPGDIALLAGYRIEVAASGLTYPTGVAFDENGALYVVEGGYAYGDEWDRPRLLRVQAQSVFVPVAEGDSNGPWTGAVFAPARDGKGPGSFYVAEGGQLRGGRILRIGMDGSIRNLVENLPSLGDHHTNGPALGPDGMLYFGQGTATNSGVVGGDNHDYGWLARNRNFHDTPCRDIALSGVNYATPDPMDEDGDKKGKNRERDEKGNKGPRGGKPDAKRDTMLTGAFSPFGVKTVPGQIVKGAVPCNGAIMRVSREGGDPELVAWGFRNPFALAFAPQGALYAIDNGYDERGSRPIWGAGELLWEIRRGAWYGWPDYSGRKSVDHAEFTPPHGTRPERLLEKPPGEEPPAPAAILPVHASADGLDFSRSEDFGFINQAFVAEFGDMSPSVGKVLEPVGFKVVRVDVARGVSQDFAFNRKGQGPASRLGTGGLERPVAVRFSPDGKSLYVVDFGIMAVSGEGPKAVRGTGVVWRIWREEPLRGPVDASDSTVARGRTVYMEKCDKCHPGGDAGLGPALNNKPLPGFLIRFQARHGMGAMPAFAEDELPQADLKDVAAYIKSL